MLREALAIREEALVPNHWGTALARSVLGACVSKLGRYREAEPLLVDGYTRLKEVVGIEDDRTQRARLQVVRHFDRAGRPEEAASYRVGLRAP